MLPAALSRATIAMSAYSFGNINVGSVLINEVDAGLRAAVHIRGEGLGVAGQELEEVSEGSAFGSDLLGRELAAGDGRSSSFRTPISLGSQRAVAASG